MSVNGNKKLTDQIIYIASGKAYFHFDNAENETVVSAGNMVLYRPVNGNKKLTEKHSD